MANLPIYLDYLATTPGDPQVQQVMQTVLAQTGNPASLHPYGEAAKAHIDLAASQVANAIHARPENIIWTSGATQSINLALSCIANTYQRQGREIITLATEHKATQMACQALEKKGFLVKYLKPNRDGLIELSTLESFISKDTLLISIMWVNNETGVVQDMAAISQLAKKHGVLFHSDAAQAIGKVKIDLTQIPVDLLSFCAHKVYGPQGIGALYIRPKLRLNLPHQGTLPVHQIVGMGKAFSLAEENFAKEISHILQLRQILLEALLPFGVRLVGDSQKRIPHCLNLLVPNIRHDALLLSLPELAFSVGSACNANNPAPSHVLLAMGLSPLEANSCIRLSLGRMSTAAEIQQAAQLLKQKIQRLNAMLPGK